MRGNDWNKEEFSPWWYCPQWRINFGCMPKCGTSTLYDVIGKNQIICWPPRENEFSNLSVFIIREPTDRFLSLWRDKCRNKQELWVGDSHAELAGLTVQQLVQHIKDNPNSDWHWKPQWRPAKKANLIVRLPYLSKWWKDFGLPPLDVKNKTETKDEEVLDEETLAWLREHYAKDYELYEGE